MTQAANLAALGTNASSTGILPAAGGGTGGTAGVTGFKNRIINGNMVISQRGTTFNDPGSNQYTIDRWHYFVSVSGKINAAQSSTAPAGFSNSMSVTSTSAYSLQAGDYFQFGQPIEWYNMSDWNWGTANAKTITISFWVRSSVTGDFGGLLVNAGGDMQCPFTYTISSANTWTYITQTIAGPTTGNFGSTNNTGVEIRFGLGIGSTYRNGTNGVWSSTNYWATTSTASLVGVNGATFYLTGVQIEVGSAATAYDFRPYTTELQLCQRYYETHSTEIYDTSGVNNDKYWYWQFKVTKRAAPTITYTGYLITSCTGDVNMGKYYGANVSYMRVDSGQAYAEL